MRRLVDGCSYAAAFSDLFCFKESAKASDVLYGSLIHLHGLGINGEAHGVQAVVDVPGRWKKNWTHVQGGGVSEPSEEGSSKEHRNPETELRKGSILQCCYIPYNQLDTLSRKKRKKHQRKVRLTWSRQSQPQPWGSTRRAPWSPRCPTRGREPAERSRTSSRSRTWTDGQARSSASTNGHKQKRRLH